MTVTIIVKDKQGQDVTSFAAQSDVSLSSQANMNGGDIFVACCTGACLVCGCTIVSGEEHVDKEKFGSQLAMLEANQVCSCIAWIYDESNESTEEKTVILQKIM